MRSGTGRALVVDSSVFRAAGPEGASAPTAKRCRDTLVALREAGHRVVYTPAIREEWERHRSRFARAWLTAMYARKRVIDLVVDEQPRLREAIDALPSTPRERAAMQKDAHLLDAALASDEAVVALDEVVRTLFGRLALAHPPVARVMWTNPTRDEDAVERWLVDGAPHEATRCLGFTKPSAHRPARRWKSRR